MNRACYNANTHMEKILISGVGSLLGKYLVKILSPTHTINGTYQKVKLPQSPNLVQRSLEIKDAGAVNALIKSIQPQVVIHLASLSNIDYCEKHPALARKVNITGTENLIKALKQQTVKPHVIFISSSMVFRGDKAPYSETDQPQPINTYGQTKFEAEKIVMKSGLSHTIIRFSTLLGWPPKGARDNDMSYYVPKLKTKQAQQLVNDRFFNPLSAATAATALKAFIQRETKGIVHIAGQDCLTRFELVKTMAQVFQINGAKIQPISSNYFPQLAPRPHNVCLTTSKMKQVLKMQPPTIKGDLQLLRSEV